MPVLHAEVLARFGHALSDPTRTRLLLALRDGPGYPSELAELVGVTRQDLPNHLACLRGCALVVTVSEGRHSRYEMADPRVAHALGDLLGVVPAVDPDVLDVHASQITGELPDRPRTWSSRTPASRTDLRPRSWISCRRA